MNYIFFANESVLIMKTSHMSFEASKYAKIRLSVLISSGPIDTIKMDDWMSILQNDQSISRSFLFFLFSFFLFSLSLLVEC